jgi:hypothetical protein
VSSTATFRFEGYLNVFLPHRHRDQAFAYAFDGQRSVKDMIEAVGVPHTEVGLILANNAAVPLTYHVQTGDVVVVRPAEIVPTPPDLRFVADVHLGRLVSYLRLLGFDTLYPDDYRDEELARISDEEQRILLTRDIGLLKRSIVRYGTFVHKTDPRAQLEEIITRYRLVAHLRIFTRCTTCNGVLIAVSKADVLHRLEHFTTQHYEAFSICQKCDKIFWRGSHYRHMRQFLAERYPQVNAD